MAETGCPVSDLFPLGSTIPSNPTVTNGIINPLLAELKDTNLDELQRSSSEIQEDILKDGGRTKEIDSCPSNAPCPISEVHISDQADTQVASGMNHPNEQVPLAISSLHRDLIEENLSPTNNCFHRSHTDTSQVQKKDQIQPVQSKTIEPSSLNKNQEAHTLSSVCAEPMHTQQSSTTFCRTANSPIQSSSDCDHVSGELARDLSPARLEAAPCCSPYHRGAVEDTFAAYCHPQPIPAPAQLVPRLMNLEGDCKGQKPGPTLLSLPPLVSSISETRLDSNRLVHCCSLDCTWPSPLCQAGSHQQLVKEVRIMRDAETMTACRELREIGVQVGQDSREDRSPQHVFPKVCLVEESENGHNKVTEHQKSPVKEVMWDSEGMTWEVYGASVDPEELGLAIQKHLELQIKETAGKAARITTSSQLPNEKRESKRRRGVMAALRPSVCCSRTSTAVD